MIFLRSFVSCFLSDFHLNHCSPIYLLYLLYVFILLISKESLLFSSNNNHYFTWTQVLCGNEISALFRGELQVHADRGAGEPRILAIAQLWHLHLVSETRRSAVGGYLTGFRYRLTYWVSTDRAAQGAHFE